MMRVVLNRSWRRLRALSEAVPTRYCFSLFKKIPLSVKGAVLVGIAVLLPVLSSQAAYAAVSYSSLNLNQKAEAWTYARMLRQCYESGAAIETNGEKLKGGQLFFHNLGINNEKRWIGGNTYSTLVERGEDRAEGGYYLCSDPGFQSAALSALGVTAVELACQLGYKSQDAGKTCQANDGSYNVNRSDVVNNFWGKINSLTGIPSDPSDAVRYVWWKNFTIGYCTTRSEVQQSVYNSTGSSVQYGIKTYVIDGTQTKEQTLYYVGGNQKSEKVHNDARNEWKSNPVTENRVEATEFKIDSTCANALSTTNRLATAYNNYLKTQINSTSPDESGGATPAPDGAETETASSCQIEAIGWILCPVMNFSAGIVDAAYGYVQSLLQVQPLLTTGTTNGAYEAWKIMRNIANIVFVIVFLVVIFSQLTSFGVSNYGVKKMLPRLVIAAILVNLSFFISALAVDISNILGSSIKGVFDSINGQIAAPVASSIENGNGWAGIVGSIVAGAAGATVLYYVQLSALIPALLAAVAAIITVFLVLTLRQALIILLIVISPLAFVAYILPNTEQLFSKWRKLLMTLLLMFPIIAALFGASALASKIVMQSAQGEYAMVIQIMGACISIIPLALTPIVMKSAGGVLNRFAGMVNNRERGPIDRLRKTGEKYREGRRNLRNARALNGEKQLGRGAFVRWQARRNAVNNGQQAELNRANTEYVADSVQNNARFRNAVAGGTLTSKAGEAANQRALSTSISAQAKLEDEELNAASVVLKNARLDQNQIRTIATGGSVTAENGTVFNGGASTAVRSAAIKTAVATNDVAAINSLWNASKTWEGEEGAKLRETFADSLQSSSIRPAYLSQGAIAGLRTNDHSDVRKTIESAIQNNTYSADRIASADKDELNVVAQVLKENHDAGASARISDDQRQKILLNAEQAITDERINVRIGKNIDQVQNIVNFRGPASNPITIDGPLETSAGFVATPAPTTTPAPAPAPSQGPAPVVTPPPSTQTPPSQGGASGSSQPPSPPPFQPGPPTPNFGSTPPSSNPNPPSQGPTPPGQGPTPPNPNPGS